MVRRYVSGFVFGGFLYAGYFKNIPGLKSVPFDLTVVFALLTIAAAGAALLREGTLGSKSIVWMLALYGLCLIPVFWTGWSGYAEEKVLRMFTLTLLASLAPFFLLKEREDLRAFFHCLVLFAALTAVDAAQNWRLGNLVDERLKSFVQDIPLGRILAIAALWFFVQALFRKRAVKLLLMAAGALFLILMIGSGARGPTTAFAGAFLVCLVAFARKSRQAWTVPLLVGFVVVIGFIAVSVAPEASQSRVTKFVTGTTNWEATDRPGYFGMAMRTSLRRPAGIGWGGFERVATGGSQASVNRMYPHNLILEAFLEGGWAVGALLLALMAVGSLRTWRRAAESPTPVWIFFLGYFTFLLVSVLFSNDWNDSRDFFAVLAIALGSEALPRSSAEDSA